MSLLALIKPVALDPAEERNLIQTVRATTSALVFDPETEVEVLKFFPTREQEDALQTLIAAYVPDITRAASHSKAVEILGRDEAEAVAVEKFINLVRNPNRTNERLAGFVSKAMVGAVLEAAQSATSVISIPDVQFRRYLGLVKQHGSTAAAYVACKTTANDMDALTFLAINRAINSDSIDNVKISNEGDTYSSDPDASAVLLTAAGLESTPEDKIVADDLVRWLFSLCTEVEEQVLRLAYGFTDTRSENQRVRNGYQWDALLSDMQISPVLGLGRQKVQRTRSNALARMRDALNSLVNDGA